MLIAYYFMWHTGHPAPEQCEGCAWFTSQVRELSYIHSRDVSYAVFCQSPYEESARYRDFMGWEMPCGARPRTRSTLSWLDAGGPVSHRLLPATRIQCLQASEPLPKETLSQLRDFPAVPVADSLLGARRHFYKRPHRLQIEAAPSLVESTSSLAALTSPPRSFSHRWPPPHATSRVRTKPALAVLADSHPCRPRDE
jgi:hypothetical protein